MLKVLYLTFAAASDFSFILNFNFNNTIAFQFYVDLRLSFPRKPRRLRQSHKQEF
jgi:hypothetical protein